MQDTTVIRNAAWIIAWDAEMKTHTYLKNADLAFCGNRITFVGQNYPGPFDREIRGNGRMVMPGLINIHTHLAAGPLDKGTFDEVGSAALWGNALYTYSQLLRADSRAIKPGAIIALIELIKSGVTTVVDNSGYYEEWIDLLIDSGVRAVLAPGFRQARWVNVGDHRVDYEWDLQAGWQEFELALKTMDAIGRCGSDRLSGMIFPSQADTCEADLLKAAHAAAVDRGLPFQTHASQTMQEFSEIMRRHGKSPVQWLDSLGILDEHTILGHCIFMDHHSWSPLHTREDLPLLAERKITVAHCPTVFGRTGMTLESFGEYVRTGVNLGIGTDSFPFNMLEELRHAGVYARIATGNVHDLTTTDVFNAATLGGAKALLRHDIGRLAVDAKADLVIVDTEHPLMRPGREPLRNLINVAAERSVRDVFIDGRPVVADGEILTLDYENALIEMDAAQIRSIRRIPDLDFQKRTLDELAPMTFRLNHGKHKM
jgi:cytosine/adenosine deaminase-related metal-dependent hydrolase